jgi:hypothetical protein
LHERISTGGQPEAHASGVSETVLPRVINAQGVGEDRFVNGKPPAKGPGRAVEFETDAGQLNDSGSGMVGEAGESNNTDERHGSKFVGDDHGG